MSALTKAQRARLAKEARRLACEIAEGTAPTFNGTLFYYDDKPQCPLAFVEVRADAPTYSICNYHFGHHRETFEASDAVSCAAYPGEQPHGAAVFPLLWLADELDGGAR